VAIENIKVPASMTNWIESQVAKEEQEIDTKYLAITYSNMNEEKFKIFEKNEKIN